MEDDKLPKFHEGYCDYVPVCFKTDARYWDGGKVSFWPSNKVLDCNPLFQHYKKPVGLKIFEEKQYFHTCVESEFRYGGM
jgi:hypothetical protein